MKDKYINLAFFRKGVSLSIIISCIILGSVGQTIIDLPMPKDSDMPVNDSNTNARTIEREWKFKENSPLAKGQWTKVGVVEDGIYCIGYDEITKYGFDVDGLNPSQIAIYGTTNRALPELNATYRNDGLEEMAIMVMGENDGKFDKDDKILFYGQSCNSYIYNESENKIEYKKNIYSDTIYYYITIKSNENGKRWEKEDNSNMVNTNGVVSTFQDCVVHEIDLENLCGYGKGWYGEMITNESSYHLQIPIKNVISGSDNANMSISIAHAANPLSIPFYTEVSGKKYILETKSNTLSYKIYSIAQKDYQISVENDLLDITLSFPSPNTSPTKAFLDYLRFDLPRAMVFNGGNYMFFENAMNNNNNEVRVKSTVGDFDIIDISDPLNVKQIHCTTTGDYQAFNTISDKSRRLLAFNDYKNIVYSERVNNQNLHQTPAVNLVILVHPSFKAEAERLSEFKRSYEGLSVMVVTQDEIFNEYSGGKQDPVAIRMFLKNMDERTPNVLRYLLLFGDGSYDYKGRVEPNTNYILTYQSNQSLIISDTFLCEDFYGIFGENSGIEGEGSVNLGIGRFPVRNIDEAKIVVDKVIHYSTKSDKNMGNWKNKYLFMADDGDGNGHLDDAELTSNPIINSAKNINVDKAYSASFPKVETTGGNLFPEVNDKMKEKMEDGVLLINYFGHAGEIGWSDERILTNADVARWTNYDYLTIIISASCQFGRFDLPEKTTTGEYALLSSKGGTIATLTSTRLAYPNNNRSFCMNFHNSILNREWKYEPRLGDFFKDGKNNSGNITGNRQFSLLGDPSLKIGIPEYKAVVSSINNITTAALSKDSTTYTKALDEVKIKGEILDKDNTKAIWWNGIITVTIFDKQRTNTTLANVDTRPIDFKVQNEEVFSAKTHVKNGDFEITFTIPKNINYSIGEAKISLYAYDTLTYKDAAGNYSGMRIGDINITKLNQAEEPTIEMKLNQGNSNSFTMNYGIGDTLTLDYTIHDAIGLFVEKSNISKSTTLLLDGTKLNIPPPEYELGIFTTTHGRYILPKLSEGEHTLTLKSFNICNISKETNYTFNIRYAETSLKIANVMATPNPTSRGNELGISFDIIDNTGDEVDVDIRVYNMNGGIVQTFNGSYISGRHTLKWKNDTLTAGLYLYKIYTKNKNGVIAITSCKQIIK